MDIFRGRESNMESRRLERGIPRWRLAIGVIGASTTCSSSAAEDRGWAMNERERYKAEVMALPEKQEDGRLTSIFHPFIASFRRSMASRSSLMMSPRLTQCPSSMRSRGTGKRASSRSSFRSTERGT